MIHSSRFDAGRYLGGRFNLIDTAETNASASVSIAGLTDNQIHGPSAQIGMALSASLLGVSIAPPASITWQWHNSGGPIADVTANTYVPKASDDLKTIHVVATPTNGFDPVVSAAHTVRHAPPVASGSINDKTLIWQSGDTRINSDVSRKFEGEALILSTTGYAGAYVEATALHIKPTMLVTRQTVTVNATNSGGTAEVSFDLTVKVP